MRTEIKDFSAKTFDNIHHPDIYYKPAIEIMERTAEYFGLWESVYFSFSRAKYVVTMRQIAIYLVCELNFYTQHEIGNLFSKDRTTVLHSRDTIKERRKDTPLIEEALKYIANN